MSDPIVTAEQLKADLQLAELFPDMEHTLPLYHAAISNRLSVAFFQRDTAMPRSWRQAGRNLPVVAVVQDTVEAPAGPATWAATSDLLAWAEIAVLHRQGAATGHYAHACELAKTHRRVLLVEATVETFEAWKARLLERMGLALELM